MTSIETRTSGRARADRPGPPPGPACCSPVRRRRRRCRRCRASSRRGRRAAAASRAAASRKAEVEHRALRRRPVDADDHFGPWRGRGGAHHDHVAVGVPGHAQGDGSDQDAAQEPTPESPTTSRSAVREISMSLCRGSPPGGGLDGDLLRRGVAAGRRSVRAASPPMLIHCAYLGDRAGQVAPAGTTRGRRSRSGAGIPRMTAALAAHSAASTPGRSPSTPTTIMVFSFRRCRGFCSGQRGQVQVWISGRSSPCSRVYARARSRASSHPLAQVRRRGAAGRGRGR